MYQFIQLLIHKTKLSFFLQQFINNCTTFVEYYSFFGISTSTQIGHLQPSTKCRNREPGSQPHPVKTGSVRHIFTICFKMIRIRHQFFFTVPDRMIYIKCAWKTIIPLPLPSCRQLLVPMHKFNLWRPLGQFHSKSKSKVSITHSNQVSQ